MTEKPEQGYSERCAFEDGSWYGGGEDKRKVLWSITGSCNYRCRHCFMSAPKGKFHEPDREQLLDIVRQLGSCGYTEVSLTGGEPLISPYLVDILEELNRQQIRLSMLHTNGARVTEQFLDRLEELNLHPAFQISFDGIGWHDWLRGVPGAEKTVLEVLRLLQKRKYRVGITMTLHRRNLDVVNETIRLLKELGVEHISMHIASPAGLWAEETQHFVSQDEVNQLLYDSIIPEFFEDGAGVGVQFCTMLEYFPERQECSIPAAKFNGRKGAEELSACSTVKNRLYISPEGFVLPCMHLAGTVMQSAFENMHEKPLQEILAKSGYRDMESLRLKDVIAHNGKCQACQYRLTCGAGCRACACGEDSMNYLGIDRETCDFFQHGWYEKALELKGRYAGQGKNHN